MTEPFIRTYTGTKIVFTNPDPKAIEIPGLFMATSRAQRFAGHLLEPWTVTEHSVLASYMTKDVRLAMGLLVHDLHEAFTGDLSSPLKRLIKQHTPVIQEVELKLNAAISEALGGVPMPLVNMTPEEDAEVKRIDRGLSWLEGNLLLPGFRDEEFATLDTLTDDEKVRGMQILMAMLADREEIGRVELKDPAIWLREKIMRRFYKLRERLQDNETLIEEDYDDENDFLI